MFQVTITILSNKIPSEDELKNLAVRELSKKGISVKKEEISAFVFRKKSLDARHKTVKTHLRYDVYTKGEKPDSFEAGGKFEAPWKNLTTAENCKEVVVVGAGPGGLFASLQLLEKGIKPILIDRGPGTKQRKIDIAKISTEGFLNDESNYCFGEGGAGTFSDGKLFTRSNKRGNIGKILAVLNFHGANEAILTDAHPHIGTDKLPGIINNICETIRNCGGEVKFSTKLVEILVEKFGGKLKVCGIVVENSITGEKSTITADSVILATGHSATDVYELLYQLEPKTLEAKTFAMGVRVEHPRELIDGIQYHGREKTMDLPPAEYRLTTQVEGRGVYSFCMCPGGLVVPSASSKKGIVVNGMSPSSRKGKFSNAAIVVETTPEDCKMLTGNDGVLAGLGLRTEIEEKAMKLVEMERALDENEANINLGKNPQAAPAQRLVDFLEGRKSVSLPKSTYTPGLVSVDLNELFPTHIAARLKQGFLDFNKQMQGFISYDAVLIAPETRTSTPVRILRDKESFESPLIEGLFPCGEGSGYAGGIVSSAMDGENVAKKVAEKLL